MGAAVLLALVGLGALATGILVGRYYVPDDRMLKRTARASRSYMRALNHLIARDHDTVIDELRKVVEDNIEDVEPYFALGALFRSRGEHERAIRVHQALAVREGGSRKLRLRARYELGLDFRAAGMPRRATRAMEECLVDDAKHEGALRALCGLYEEQGRYAEAAAAWDRLARLRGEPSPRRAHHLLVAAAQRALAAGDRDSAKRFLRDARKHAETAHFFAVAAELAAARDNPRAASARVQQALAAAPELARFLVPGLIEAERQLAAAAAPRADASDAARGLDADLAADAHPDAAAAAAAALPVPAATEAAPAAAVAAALDRPGAGGDDAGDATGGRRRAPASPASCATSIATPPSARSRRCATSWAAPGPTPTCSSRSPSSRRSTIRRARWPATRALAAAFPQLLPARVAAARLALAADDAAAVRAELTALAGAGGTLDWAFDGAWRCGHCGFRGKAFFWRCGQCRRWGSARLDVGRDAQLPVRVHAPRERREVPRVPVHQTLLGAAATEALPEPTLEHGLSDDELARLGARPSVLGRMGGWFSGAWSGMRGKRRS
ncbi:MAG: hypothetical protein H6708_31245 [Kofleriaceae bacterium]|nr:hypothetical protein [Kofleriaceae bacterium]